MNKNWFEDWFNSPHYHRLYQHRDTKEAALFINNLIEHLAPKQDALMLDIACGKGRHALQLAEKGFDVTGIDLSEESINEALKMESERLHFYKHDMRLPFWINYFDYAFNFFTSFGYFNTKREDVNAIRSISQSLKSKGILVMDYINVTFAINNLEKETNKIIDNTTYHISRWHDERFIYKKITVEDDALHENLSFTERVAIFNLDSFTELFSAQGLTIKEVYGDYNFTSFDEMKSPRLIMIAEKIK
jgi:SAM-dependent methyltransferase